MSMILWSLSKDTVWYGFKLINTFRLIKLVLSTNKYVLFLCQRLRNVYFFVICVFRTLASMYNGVFCENFEQPLAVNFFHKRLHQNVWQDPKCVVLCDLVPFVQFKKLEKYPWRSVNFNKNKVAGSSLQLY